MDLQSLEKCYVLTGDRPWMALVHAFGALFQASGLKKNSLKHILESNFNMFATCDTATDSKLLYIDSVKAKTNELQLLQRGAPHAIPLISLGKPCPAVKVSIIEPFTNRLAPLNRIGEVLISSIYNAESFVGLDDNVQGQIIEDLLHHKVSLSCSSQLCDNTI